MRLSPKTAIIRTETKWSGFPPEHWVKFCAHKHSAPARSELARAEWLWERRPKRVLFDSRGLRWSRVIIFFLALLVLCFFDVVGLLVAAALSFAVAAWLTLDLYRSVSWKRDYDASIARVLRH
jgi:Flp pilus assembly protein TadB